MSDSEPLIVPDSKARVVVADSKVPPLPANSLLRPATPEQEVTITVFLKRQLPLPTVFLMGESMDRAQYSERHAASSAAMQAVERFAQTYGFTVDQSASSRIRRTVMLHGTTLDVENAFGVKPMYCEYENGGFYTYEGEITLPPDLAPHTIAVLGLDTRPIARPHFRVLDPALKAQAKSFTPPQVAQAYNFPTGVDGTGQTIGIIELGGGFQTSDISTYFNQLGLPVPQVTAVMVDGGKNQPGDPNGADAEVMLDIEVSGSVAPGSKIAVYFAPNTDQGFLDALTTAIHDTTNNPSVISISWGAPESSWTGQALTAFDSACQSAAALGVSIACSAGDGGSSDGVTDGANHVDFPSSGPHVLACGGTKLSLGPKEKIISEVVWNDGASGGATGGGVSNVFPKPSWQKNAKVPPPKVKGGGRGVPDVAGDASPMSGYQVLVDGKQEVVGGTSAVAPLWAGLIALINQKIGKPVGFVNPKLYAPPATGGGPEFFDITKGNNGAFKAGKGWDACTGLGSPNGAGLIVPLSGKTHVKAMPL
jgi:kumamolisin